MATYTKRIIYLNRIEGLKRFIYKNSIRGSSDLRIIYKNKIGSFVRQGFLIYKNVISDKNTYNKRIIYVNRIVDENYGFTTTSFEPDANHTG